MKIIVQQRVLCLLSVHAPQFGLSDAVNNLFNCQLRVRTASKVLIPCRDWNGHAGRTGSDYKEIHGGCVYGELDPDIEGETIL